MTRRLQSAELDETLLEKYFLEGKVTGFDLAIMMNKTAVHLVDQIPDKNAIDFMDGVKNIIDQQFEETRTFFYAFIVLYVLTFIIPFLGQVFATTEQ